MLRKKKITIKYYLNKKLKAVSRGDETLYPVYVRVIYKTKNTRFSLSYINVNHGGLSESEFNELFLKKTHSDTREYINWFSKLIEDAIRFEETFLKDNFKLSGISKRLLFYQDYFLPVIERYIEKVIEREKELSKEIEDSGLGNEPFHYVDMLEKMVRTRTTDELPYHVNVLLTAYIQYLNFNSYLHNTDEVTIDRHSLPKVSDWISGKHKNQFIDFLYSEKSDKRYLGQNEHSVLKIIYDDFPLMKSDIQRYIKSLDMAILETIE